MSTIYTCEQRLHYAVLRREAVVGLHRRRDLLLLGLLLLFLQRLQDDLRARLLIDFLSLLIILPFVVVPVALALLLVRHISNLTGRDCTVITEPRL